MVFKGILLGGSLALLTGPLLFTILQATLERGRKAGFWVAAGIWVSDILYILTTFLALRQIVAVTEWPGFHRWLGLGGGLILALFGVGLFFSGAKNKESVKLQEKGGGSYWLAGFLVNTINPFTVVFWTSLAGTVLVEQEQASWPFYLALMGTIILTDSLKVWGAAWIRKRLTPQKILLTRRVAGAIIFGFGLALVYRTWF